MADPAALSLSAAQLHALFDILTHHETYREIQGFRDPDAIASYGWPFAERTAGDGNGNGPATATTYAAHSTSPLLHMLFSRTVLSLPPARTLPPAFWHVRVQTLIAQLAEADLSESYDQGAMGTRKILATAASALLESVGRGALGGYPVRRASGEAASAVSGSSLAGRTYDTANAVDFAQAWDDVLRAMVYGNLVDELFVFCAGHRNIEDHSPAVKAAVDYVIVHLAEFLHYVFVLSPNGRYLAKLIESVHQLVPYTVIRQTLRVSNAATMINGMMKLLLAKLSVGGLTNWIGLTTSADDGMNLLQRIVSLVLSYDASNFKKAADRIEKAKDGPSKAHLAAIREHLARPRQYHDAIRRESMDKGQSMVAAILASANPSLVTSLSDAQHAQCAQYYAALLSVSDRRAITTVLCRQSPDYPTQVLREVVAACDPIIRGIHDKIDLKEHVADMEAFISEFIDVTKGVPKPAAAAASLLKKEKGAGDERALPTVKDYVALLRRNRHLLYKWMHRVAKDTPDIRDTFRTWAVETIKLFRGPAGGSPSPPGWGAGAMSDRLAGLFAGLPAEAQATIQPLLDEHAAYLTAVDEAATLQRQALLDKIYAPVVDGAAPDSEAGSGRATAAAAAKPMPGSGRFIARWQALLDATPIGPATANGPLRRGREVSHITAPGKTGVGASAGSNAAGGGGGGTGPGGDGSKLLSLVPTGFMSGFASGRSSRQPSPERPVSNAGPPTAGRISTGPQPPDVAAVVDAMGGPFHRLLRESL